MIRAPIYDAGTVSLTVDGTTASATFGQGSTAGSIAQTIAEGFWLMPSSAVAVSAVGGQVTMAAAAGGSGSGYAYSVTTTYDSGDFAAASFSPSSISGDLSGAESGVQVPIYAYNAAGGYDTNGNVLSYTDTVMGPWNFGYDQLNRLVTAQNGDAYLAGTPDPPAHSWAANFCWAYDAFGNRLQQSTSNVAFSAGESDCVTSGTVYQNTWASYNTNNQIVSSNASGIADPPSYDAAGDMADDDRNAYLYDAEGRICVTWGPEGGTGYLYDAAGNRVAKGTINAWTCDMTANGFTMTEWYVIGPSGEQLTETDGSGNWKHTNVSAGGQLVATYDADPSSSTQALHFQFADWLGSRRVQTDYEGNIEETCQSLPFGDGLNCAQTSLASADDATEHHFTGKERDTESGNDDFGARYYNSATGRWLSPDWSDSVQPVPYAKLEDPQSLNLYSYVYNNPLTVVDADGHDGCSVEGVAVSSCDGLANNEGAEKDASEEEQIAEQMFAYSDAHPDDNSMDAVGMAAERAALKPTRASIANGNRHEYGGLILRRDNDGKLSYTKPIPGTATSVDVDSIAVQAGYTAVGEYHTHPHTTDAEGEGPSTTDIYRLRTPELAGRTAYVANAYSGAVYRYTQNEPVQGPYDTHVYGTKIGTIP